MATKKEYELVAKVIRELPIVRYGTIDTVSKDVIIESFVEEFGNDNERFDADRFREACYAVKSRRVN